MGETKKTKALGTVGTNAKALSRTNHLRFDEEQQNHDTTNQSLNEAVKHQQTKRSISNEPNVSNEAKKQQSQAEVLLELSADLELFHDQNGEAHVFLDGQCLKLKSDTVKKYLSYKMYQEHGKPPNTEALGQAVATLQGIAIFERDQRNIENRVAKHDQGFLYDLGNHQAVYIAANGWGVIEAPPKFRRYKHQAVQVIPIGGGDVHSLFNFINVSSENQLLVLVTLISYFVPGIPHPIFHPWGPQGSGKTSLFRAFKRLVDPSTVEILMCSTDRTRVIHAMVMHYLPLFDNLSRLNAEISDLLCQACTGGGIEQRQLYTDDESVIFQILRCVGINGINLSIAKPDLLDRTLLLHLERIAPHKRREEAALWKQFEEARPHILGGIFDILSRAMAVYPLVKLDQLPRLADFGRWGYAIAEAIEPGLGRHFIEDYQRNVDQQVEESIQGNTLATTLLTLMDTRDVWDTTIGEAFITLKLLADPDRYDKTFPASPKDLRRYLERLKTTLEERGITYNINERTAEGYPIVFHKYENFASSATSGSFDSNEEFSNDEALVAFPHDGSAEEEAMLEFDF